MSVEDKTEKDVKSPEEGDVPPPHTEIVNGVLHHGSAPALELDMEELSGSLLVDEHLEYAIRAPDPPPDGLPKQPRSVPPPLPGMSSRPPGPSSLPPPLPKPVPPPMHPEASSPEASEIATTDGHEPLELDVTFSSEEASAPATSDGDDAPRSSAPDSDPTPMAAAPIPPPPAAPALKPALPPLPDPVPPPLSPTAEQAVTLFKAPSPALPFTPLADIARTVPIERAEIVMPEPGALAAAFGGDVELTTLPRGVLPPPAIEPSKEARSTSTLPPSADADRSSRGKGRGVLYAVAALAGAAALAAVVVQAVRSRDHALATVSGAPLTTVPQPRVIPAPPEPAPSPSSAGPCKLAGEPRVIAPEAVVATGIEARAFGDEIALGFASGDHHASLIHIDATGLTAKPSTTKPYAAVIRRATPVQSKKGKVSLLIDVDKKGDAIHGRRTLDLDPPLQLGAAKQHVVWAPIRHKPAGKLWPLESDDGVEAPRGAQSGSDPIDLAFAFRSGGSLWMGQAQRSGSSLAAQGDLVRLGRQGEMVGAPAVASSDGIVMVAWAERKSADDPWRMRWVRFKAGELPGNDHAFMVPAGGPGEQAMAPGLTALSGGRFLLVWTEGPASGHEVRAITLSSEGTAMGEPLRISAAGANAGQGQPAVTSSGRGVVAFLQAEGAVFEVVTTPIACTL